MSNPDQRSVLLGRLLRRSLALACTAALLLGPSSASAGTVLTFGQQNPADVITASVNNGVTTLSTTGNADGAGVSIPVSITNYLGVPQVPFPILAFETFVGVHSTGTATNTGTTVSQNFVGEVDFTVNPGPASAANPAFLIATFSGPNGTLSGGTAGGGTGLNASVPSDSVTFTVPGLSFVDAAISLSFSGITVPPGLGITGGTTGPFTAQGAGTFSASISTVPEPSTMALSTFPLVLGGLIYRRKRKSRSEA